MKKINPTTYQADLKDGLEVIVGDEKQAAFYPRVKLKKWNNEVNFSIGPADAKNWRPKLHNETITADKRGYRSRFYKIEKNDPVLPTKLRRVVSQGILTPYEASAEYEVFRTQAKDKLRGTIAIADYVVPEPSLMVFDQMPTSRYLEVDGNGYASDFNYQNKPYHPADIPMPQLQKVPVCRIYSPYSAGANPYFMDNGLHNIDIQHAGNRIPDIMQKWTSSIIEVLARHKVKAYYSEGISKVYFRHRGRDVKFHSAENARGVLAAYINIDSSYNKAYDFYRPDVEKDVRNQYAYGIKQAYPHIDHWIVDEIIIRFAKKCGLKVQDKPYNKIETDKWRKITELHKDIGWIKTGQRTDANWFYQEERDGFEFEIDIPAKPKNNVIEFSIQTKELDFYYQPPLTPEEIGRGLQRPPDVVGSYAVYHRSKKDNQYKTGKAFHIYRPIAVDATGWHIFCDLNVDTDKEILSVNVPPDFLDKATYPITVDPTFGYQTQGGSTVSYDDTIVGTVQTSTSVGGELQTISFYGATSTDTTTEYEGAVYRASDGVLIGQSTNGTASQSITWTTLNFANESISASTSYVLAVWGDNAGSTPPYDSNTIAYDSTGGVTSKYKSHNYSANNWPTPITWDADEANTQYSIYVTYLGVLEVNLSDGNSQVSGPKIV